MLINYVGPLIDELLYLKDNGIRVYDAHIKAMVQVSGMLLFTTSDIRGTPDLTGKVHSNSFENACIRCSVIGFKTYGLRKLEPLKLHSKNTNESSSRCQENNAKVNTWFKQTHGHSMSIHQKRRRQFDAGENKQLTNVCKLFSRNKKRKQTHYNDQNLNTNETTDATVLFQSVPDAVCYKYYCCYLPMNNNYRKTWQERMNNPIVVDDNGNNVSISSLPPPALISKDIMLQQIINAEKHNFTNDIVKATGIIMID